MRTPSQHHQARFCLSNTRMPVPTPRLKSITKSPQPGMWLAAARWLKSAVLALPLSLPASAYAAFLKGEALDKVADVLTWVVLIVAPIVGIGVFLIVHILPEKIAEKRQHPQAKAIQVLCLLSLVFGGLLWPIAWLWAYTKPVLHEMAYGADKATHGREEGPRRLYKDEAEELKQLRKRVAELETKLSGKAAA